MRLEKHFQTLAVVIILALSLAPLPGTVPVSHAADEAKAAQNTEWDVASAATNEGSDTPFVNPDNTEGNSTHGNNGTDSAGNEDPTTDNAEEADLPAQIEQEALPQTLTAPPALTPAADRMIYVSSSGSDATGDGSEANPYATIIKAYYASSAGDTIVLLSDISMNSLVGVWHSLTIKSKDGEGPYRITRASGFAKASDRARREYNPAMFELHSDNGPAVLRFENVIVDDNHATEGTVFAGQDTNGAGGNSDRVQDAIVAVYEDPNMASKATLILGAGATLQNYGGMRAVFLSGKTTEFIMESGSRITNNGQSSKGTGAVTNGRGYFEMKQGSTIDGTTGTLGPALFSSYGTNYIDGIISNCKGTSGDYAVMDLQGGQTEIAPNAKIHSNTSKHGTIYAFYGAVLTVRGEIYNNISDAETTWSSGIYASDVGPGGPATVYIEDGAYIHDNKPYLYWGFIEAPYVAAVFANNNATVIMNGGRIVDNDTPFAVMVRKNGTFIMNGGEISGNQTALNIENYQNEVSGAKMVLNGGTVSGNDDAVCIVESEWGFRNGSYVYLDANLIAQSTDVNFKKVEMLYGMLPVHTTVKTITADTSRSGLYLGNASAKGKTALAAVPEVAEGRLLTTWFGASKDNRFAMTVEGLSPTNDDVHVCIVPVDERGEPLGGYKISKCTKTISGSSMTVAFAINGTGNGAGYAFGLFTRELDTITYRLDGGEYNGSTDDIVESYSQDSTIKIHEAPSKEGYVFLGWEEDGQGTVYSPGQDYDLHGHVTMTAKWKKQDPPAPTKFKITYDLNGGQFNGSTEDIVETHNEGDVIKIHEAPTRAGYTFLYWKGSEYHPGDDYPVTEDHTLTAQWQKNPPAMAAGKKSPATGDSDWNPMVLPALLLSAGTWLAAVQYRRRKERF